MNLIHGRHVFRVAGFNMVLSDQDATIFMENGLGTTFTVVVDEVISKQLIKAHTAELLPAGDYKLVVKSRAGDETGPLQTASRRVKYLRVVDPEPVPIAQTEDGTVKVYTQSDNGQGEVFHAGPGREWLLTGEGLRQSAGVGAKWEVNGAAVAFGNPGGTSEQRYCTATCAEDAKSVTLSNIAIPAGTYTESHIMLELYNPNDPTDMVTLELPRITVVAEE